MKIGNVHYSAEWAVKVGKEKFVKEMQPVHGGDQGAVWDQIKKAVDEAAKKKAADAQKEKDEEAARVQALKEIQHGNAQPVDTKI